MIDKAEPRALPSGHEETDEDLLAEYGFQLRFPGFAAETGAEIAG
jgi:hypothetical protein